MLGRVKRELIATRCRVPNVSIGVIFDQTRPLLPFGSCPLRSAKAELEAAVVAATLMSARPK